MSTPQQRAEWRKLAAAATPGEWVPSWSWEQGPDFTYAAMGEGPVTNGRELSDCAPQAEADAAFIAAARAAVPALLADVDALTQERDNAYRLLESLTPGGSEFSDNPEACAGWARNRVGMTSKIAAERNELRKERDALAAELATERGLLNMVPEYLRYVAAWRAGDGSFLVFNEWVAQRTAEPLLWKASTRPLWTDDAQA